MKKIIYFFTKYFIKTLFLPFLRIDYQQYPNFLNTGPMIFTANHPSTLDPIFVMSILKTTVSILITQSVFYIPLIGFILKKTGHIPVAESQGSLAYQQAKHKLENGQSILIFPEGHLSLEDGTTKPFFSGAVRLAMETHASIVPLGISIQANRAKIRKFTIKDSIEYARFYLRGKYALTFGRPFRLSGDITDKEVLEVNKSNLSQLITHLSQTSSTRITNS